MRPLDKYYKIAQNAQIAYYLRAADALGLKYEMVAPAYTAKISDTKTNRHWFIIKSILPVNSITSAMLSRNKHLATKILKDAGVPVALQEELRDEQEAIRFYEREKDIVIKPKRNIGGKSVSILPSSPDEVSEAFRYARDNDLSDSKIGVIGEKFIPGVNFRLLVAGDQVIGAVMRKPASVVGDGISTVSELIKQKSLANKKAGRSAIKVDEQVHLKLRYEGVSMESILPSGKELHVRFNSNLTTGGTTVECLADVAPQYHDMAVSATKALALRVAGVDLITRDITQYSEDAIINEVNHNPGLRLHYNVDEGEVVDVAMRVMEEVGG